MKVAINPYSLSKSNMNFFNTMIDAIITSMESRFVCLNKDFENFGFLYDLNKLKYIPKEEIFKKTAQIYTLSCDWARAVTLNRMNYMKN